MRKQSLLNPKTSESKFCSMPYEPSDQNYKPKKRPCLNVILMACLCTNVFVPNLTFAATNIDLADLTYAQGFAVYGAAASD